MLTAAGEEVDEAEVLESVANHSRFDVFALADAVLAGETARAFKILWGLRAEGVAPGADQLGAEPRHRPARRASITPCGTATTSTAR